MMDSIARDGAADPLPSDTYTVALAAASVAHAEWLTTYAGYCQRGGCRRWHPWRVPYFGCALLCPACAGWCDYLIARGVTLDLQWGV